MEHKENSYEMGHWHSRKVPHPAIDQERKDFCHARIHTTNERHIIKAEIVLLVRNTPYFRAWYCMGGRDVYPTTARNEIGPRLAFYTNRSITWWDKPVALFYFLSSIATDAPQVDTPQTTHLYRSNGYLYIKGGGLCIISIVKWLVWCILVARTTVQRLLS